MFCFPRKFIRRNRRRFQCSLARTYQAISSASVDDLWHKIVDLADMSWHPILGSTNVPSGLVVKPGLLYQGIPRLFPIPIPIFVERVRPGELLSVRILVLPGLEEQVIYRVRSTVCGACVSYSVILRGWLSPLLWSFLRPHAARVASSLVQAVEQTVAGELKPVKPNGLDF
jgi:hypothetical protein